MNTRRGLFRLWLAVVIIWFLVALVFFGEDIQVWLNDEELLRPFLLLFWPLPLYPIARWVMKGFQPDSSSAEPRSARPTRVRFLAKIRAWLAHHPALILVTLMTVIAIAALVVLVDVVRYRPIVYKLGFGGALWYVFLSPVISLVRAAVTMVSARVFIRPWQRYWVAYRATLLLEYSGGAVLMLAWALAALNRASPDNLVGVIPVYLLGGAWVFGRFLQRGDGNSIGYFAGGKIIVVSFVLSVLLYLTLEFITQLIAPAPPLPGALFS